MVDRNIEVVRGEAAAERTASLGGNPLASAVSAEASGTEEVHLLAGGVAHVKAGTVVSIGFVPYRSVAWTDLSTTSAARRSAGIVRILAPHAPEPLPSLTFADPTEASAFYAVLLAAMGGSGHVGHT